MMRVAQTPVERRRKSRRRLQAKRERGKWGRRKGKQILTRRRRREVEGRGNTIIPACLLHQ